MMMTFSITPHRLWSLLSYLSSSMFPGHKIRAITSRFDSPTQSQRFRSVNVRIRRQYWRKTVHGFLMFEKVTTISFIQWAKYHPKRCTGIRSMYWSHQRRSIEVKYIYPFEGWDLDNDNNTFRPPTSRTGCSFSSLPMRFQGLPTRLPKTYPKFIGSRSLNT